MQPRDVPPMQESDLERMRQSRDRGPQFVPRRAAVHLPMIEQISVSTLRQLMPVSLIDVREKVEYDAGHVPGADWIPMSLIPLRVQDFSTTTPTYLICRTGNRSGQVAMWLSQRGIPAVNVDGGTEAWQRAGYPITTDPVRSTA